MNAGHNAASGAQHLTAEVTADSGEYQVLARWDTPKVGEGRELPASSDRDSGRRQ